MLKHICFILLIAVTCINTQTIKNYTDKNVLFDDEGLTSQTKQVHSVHTNQEENAGKQTKADIIMNIDNAESNLDFITKSLGSKWFLCPVIKANAYGHGTELYARLAAHIGLTHVCLVDDWEAMVIRDDENNPSSHNLTLVRIRAAAFPEYGNTIDLGIEESIGSYNNIDALARVAKERSKTKSPKDIGIHISIDTSMSRNGFYLDPELDAETQVQEMVDYIKNAHEHFKVKGFMTHLGLSNTQDIDELITRFLHSICPVAERLAAENPEEDMIIHFANTRAYSFMKSLGHSYTCEMVSNRTSPPNLKYMIRAGKAIYGLVNPDPIESGGDGLVLSKQLKSVMALQTRIAAIHYVKAGSLLGYGKVITTRDAIVGTLGIGWADGFPSSLNGNLMNGTTDARAMVFDVNQTWKCKVVVMRPPNMNAMLIDLTHCSYFKDYNRPDILDDVIVEMFGDNGVTALELSRVGNMGSPSFVTTILGKAKTPDIGLEYLCSDCDDLVADSCSDDKIIESETGFDQKFFIGGVVVWLTLALKRYAW